jgi:hypothetical protein
VQKSFNSKITMQPKPIIGYSIYAYKGGRKEKYFRETHAEAKSLDDHLQASTRRVYFAAVQFTHNSKTTK